MNKKEDLIKTFEDLREALKTCNVQELNKLIADDYSGFSLRGTIEIKNDILVNFKPGGIQLSKYEVSGTVYEVFSEIGIVSGQGYIAGSYDHHEFQHKVLFIDIFKYIEGRWRYFRSQVTEIQPY